MHIAFILTTCIEESTTISSTKFNIASFAASLFGGCIKCAVVLLLKLRP